MQGIIVKVVIALSIIYILMKVLPMEYKEGADFLFPQEGGNSKNSSTNSAFYYPFSLAGRGGDIPSLPSFRKIPESFNNEYFSLADDPYRALFKPNQEFDKQFSESNQIAKAAVYYTCGGDVSPHYY